jgi:hypothetical protein
MKLGFALLMLSSLAVPSRTFAQAAEPDQAPAEPPVSQPVTVAERPVSWKLLLPNLIADQERIWTFPARLLQGQNLLPTAAFLGTTAGLVALDPIEGGFFRRTSTFQGFNTLLHQQCHDRGHHRDAGLALPGGIDPERFEDGTDGVVRR